MSVVSRAQPRAAAPRASGLPVVCQLVHSLNIGGAELLATRLAARLCGEARFVFACLDQEGPLSEGLSESGIPWIHLRRRPGLDWRCSQRLSHWLRDEQVSAIHAHQYTPFLYALLSGAARKRPPIIFTEHGRFFPDRSSWKRRFIARRLLRPGDRIIAVGKSVKQALVDVERLPADQIGVIYNGIPVAPRPDEGIRQRLRASVGASPATLVIAQVARFDPIKNHELAIAALHRLSQQLPDAQLWLVGDGPRRAATTSLVDSLGLSQHTRFWGERSDVPDILASADIGLLSSHSEGIPLVLIEAMSAGLPVVSTAVGGAPELITPGVEGALTPPGDVDALAAELLTLATSPALRSKWGAAGRVRAQLFTEDKMISEYAEIYRQVLVK